MRRCGSNSSPLAAAALLLLLVLLLVAGCFHCAAAAARHLPSPGAQVQALDHQAAENAGKAASAGADGAGGLVLQEGSTGKGDELSSTLLETTTTMGADACEELGNDKDECVLRRLLVDAHLDYIYTQHKGKP